MNRAESTQPREDAEEGAVVTRGPVVALAWLALVAALIVAVLAPFGDAHWLIDAFTHLRLHALLAASVALVLAAVKRRRMLACAAAVLVVVHGWVVAPWQLYSFPGSDAAVTKRATRLLVWNINRSTTDARPLLGLVGRHDPDIVGVVEFSPALAASDAIVSLRKRYPLSMELPQRSTSGMAVFARRGVSFQRIDLAGGPPVVTAVQPRSDGTIVRYWFVHPPPPIGEQRWHSRGRFFAALAEEIRGMPEQRHVIAGDFNCTPWTDDFRRLCAETGLRDSRYGHGMQASWPRSLRILGIPIDHVLVPPEWHVIERSVDYPTPSDHGSVFIHLLPSG